MYRVGVLGATGYAGVEVCRLLSRHKGVELTFLGSHSYGGQKISDIYTNLRGILDKECEEINIDVIAEKCDLVFTALPHGASKEVIPALYEKGLTIIDLSGDFRYNDAKVYEQWYGQVHTAPELLDISVYGMPELYRDKIKSAKLVGNPGCYTTCSILGLAPAVASKAVDTKNIIIDAKSGVTGAGRGAKIPNLYCEVNETMKAYGVATHKHTSEIEQEISILAGEEVKLSFTPHLIPLNRGILSTMYANLNKDMTAEELCDIYKVFYKGERFVRVMPSGVLPEVKNVAGSNFIDIGVTVDKRLKRAIIVSCIDNLLKGAAGQAVQNMNIMLGFDEDTGIDMVPAYL